MNLHFRVAISAALLSSTGLFSTAGLTRELDIPQVAPGNVAYEDMKEATRVLSSDEFEGRAVGTAGEEKTVAYLIEQFKAAGLTPGNGESWVQQTPFIEITGHDFSPLTIRGKGKNLAFSYGKQWVGASYRTDNPIAIKNSELVFVGYGIVAPEKGWNDYAGLNMKGKTAVILINDPDFYSEGLTGLFGGKAMTYYGRWTYKFEEAARQGAEAAIIIHETAPAAYGWNVVESSWSGPQAHPDEGANAPRQTKLNSWAQKDVMSEVFRAAGLDLAQLSIKAQQKGFKAVPLGLKLGVNFKSDVRRFQSQNVIGVLKGAKRPDEYVIHTAHWDHLGRCTPAPDGDDICNGAIDNATGTAALVALAKAHSKAGPADRSLAFLAVTGEESGLLGSAYFGAHPVMPLNQIVGGVNMDGLMIAGATKDVTVVGKGKSELDAYLDAALAKQGRVATSDPSPAGGYYYRSDHFSLAKQGVPMLYIDGGEDMAIGGRAAGEKIAAEYRAQRYHGPKDEFDANWDWPGVTQDLNLFYDVARMIAMSTSWPNWNEGDEFRAARDKSCGKESGC